jgi:hypothetical protein
VRLPLARLELGGREGKVEMHLHKVYLFLITTAAATFFKPMGVGGVKVGQADLLTPVITEAMEVQVETAQTALVRKVAQEMGGEEEMLVMGLVVVEEAMVARVALEVTAQQYQ